MRTSSQNVKESSPTECLPLMDAAHINLYKDNPFRITGLAVDASEKDIRKAADKLKMMEELGHGQGANTSAYTPNPPATADQIKTAMQRLKEPEHRLIDEFFWFWPLEFGKSSSDPAIQAILSGDSGTAYDIWLRMESDVNNNYIAWHNIAVMFHLIALDWSVYHISSEIDKARVEKIKDYWKESFTRWEKLAEDDRLWDMVKSRIRQLDDPRLTTGFVRKMRRTFPIALDKINAELALQFAEQGRMDYAKIHVNFMNETHQGLDDVESVSDIVLKPVRTRVLQLINNAKSECNNSPEKGAEIVEKLIAQCKSLHELFELFYGKDAHQKNELFDDVAKICLSCLIKYGDKTKDESAFTLLLKEALAFATSIEVIQNIQKNISFGEKELAKIKLEPFFDHLKGIQESKASAFTRFAKFKMIIMPEFTKLSEQYANDDELLTVMSNSCAIVLRGISIDAHNNEKDFNTALDAITLASKLAKETELKNRISNDLETVRENDRAAKTSAQLQNIQFKNQQKDNYGCIAIIIAVIIGGIAGGIGGAFVGFIIGLVISNVIKKN